MNGTLGLLVPLAVGGGATFVDGPVLVLPSAGDTIRKYEAAIYVDVVRILIPIFCLIFRQMIRWFALSPHSR